MKWDAEKIHEEYFELWKKQDTERYLNKKGNPEFNNEARLKLVAIKEVYRICAESTKTKDIFIKSLDLIINSTNTSDDNFIVWETKISEARKIKEDINRRFPNI